MVKIIIDKSDVEEILSLLDKYLQILTKEAVEKDIPYCTEGRSILDLQARLTITAGCM